MFSELSIRVHLAWHNLRRRKKVLCLIALLMFIFLLVCKHTSTENSSTRDHKCSSPTSMRCTILNANIPGRVKENNHIENNVPIITDKVIQDIEYISHKTSLCKHFGQRYASVNALSPVMTSLNCGKEELFYAESNMFRLNNTILKGHRLKQCTYRPLVRTNDSMTSYKQPTTRTQKPFDIHVEDDFVRISCQLVEAGKTLNKSHKQMNKLQRDFDQFLAMINPKPSVYERISRQLMQGIPGQRMNVLVLGLDSVSHLAFQRHLPRTYR